MNYWTKLLIQIKFWISIFGFFGPRFNILEDFTYNPLNYIWHSQIQWKAHYNLIQNFHHFTNSHLKIENLKFFGRYRKFQLHTESFLKIVSRIPEISPSYRKFFGKNSEKPEISIFSEEIPDTFRISKTTKTRLRTNSNKTQP